MWKKDEAENTQENTRASASAPAGRSAPAPQGSGARAAGGRATIGRSITIQGEVTGDEDLAIEGRVEGSVNLKQHAVEIGPEGQVTADVSGRVVTVEGHVEGNLRASERVILRKTAHVEGDITCPRVTLEDGAYFRGGVEMTDSSVGSASGMARESGSSASSSSAGSSSSSSRSAGASSSTGDASDYRKGSEKSAAAASAGD